MSDVNFVMGKGRIISDPIAKNTKAEEGATDSESSKSGTPYCLFTIGINHYKKSKEGPGEMKSMALRCIAFNSERRKLADVIKEFGHKGRSVFFTARIHYREWTDAQGQKRRSQEFMIQEIQFLESKDAPVPFASNSDFALAVVSGRVAQPVKLDYIPSGAAVAQIRIATGRGAQSDKTDFHTVKNWDRGKQLSAQWCARDLKVGSPIMAVCDLDLDEWTTPEGEKRTRLDLVAKSHPDYPRAKAAEGEGGASTESKPETAPSTEGFDDLPHEVNLD